MANNHYPKLGDILAVNRGLYYHYGIYSGENRVIHYAVKSGDFMSNICVHETTFANFRNGKQCAICRFPKTYRKSDIGTKLFNMIQRPNIFTVIDSASSLISELTSSSFHQYSGQDTVERARSRLGENKYNLVFNNCEHFAIWCKTGISESKQVNVALSLLTQHHRNIELI
jgi:hypothetical protein